MYFKTGDVICHGWLDKSKGSTMLFNIWGIDWKRLNSVGYDNSLWINFTFSIGIKIWKRLRIIFSETMHLILLPLNKINNSWVVQTSFILRYLFSILHKLKMWHLIAFHIFIILSKYLCKDVSWKIRLFFECDIECSNLQIFWCSKFLNFINLFITFRDWLVNVLWSLHSLMEL
jgi:hypothetical protein